MLRHQEAANLMMKTGNFYKSAELARDMNISSAFASQLVSQIINGSEFETEVKETVTGRQVKVIGKAKPKPTVHDLWSLALFNKPLRAA